MSEQDDRIDVRGEREPVDDGLLECAAGALFLVLAAGWAANPALLPIGVAVVVVFGPTLLRRVREKVTDPRVGRAHPADRAGDGIEIPGFLFFVAGASAAFVVVVAATGNLGDVEGWRRWSGLLAGLLTSGGFLAAGERSGLRRHQGLAAASVLVGFVAGLVSKGVDYASVGWYFLMMGLLLVALGLVVLARFLRRNPVLSSVGR